MRLHELSFPDKIPSQRTRIAQNKSSSFSKSSVSTDPPVALKQIAKQGDQHQVLKNNVLKHDVGSPAWQCCNTKKKRANGNQHVVNPQTIIYTITIFS